MVKLPEDASKVLDGLVEGLKSRESISGIGLFGSRSRGDAVTVSDIDLLVIDKRDFDYEYVERAEIDGLFIDLDFVPKKWILQRVPSEIDQKLFETQIIFDQDRSLSKAKDLMMKIFRKPERAEIRTESYIMKADSYLSRALSAHGKEDFQSTVVYAIIGLETMMQILVEVARMPISNSHFIETLEASSKELGMESIYDDYLKMSEFSNRSRSRMGSMMDSLLNMWRESVRFIELNSVSVKRLHVKVSNALKYYGKESFLRGFSTRARHLADNGSYEETWHYIFRTSMEMLENYMWLASAIDKTRFDYTVLFQQLRDCGSSPKEIYENAVETLGIAEITSQDAQYVLGKAREDALAIRQERKELITHHLEP